MLKYVGTPHFSFAMKNKEYNFSKNFLFFTSLKYAQICSKALKKRFVTTPIECKNHTSAKRRHIQYNICDDTLAVRYSADIVPEKKSHKQKFRVRYFCNLL